jgi:tetratricopeptide (TPR) repeat protein
MPEDPIDARLAAVAVARDLPDGLLLEALGDVLRWGTPKQKAQAIGLAARDLRPGGEALLRLAVADPAVRDRAEALRPVAERQLLARAEALRAAGGASRGLARHLDRAAFSGLLDPEQEAAFRAEAMAVWQRLAETHPGDAEAQAALGRDLLALGRFAEARRALEAALSLGVATPAVIGWLAECHFRARDFTALDALCCSAGAPATEAGAARPPRLAMGVAALLGAAMRAAWSRPWPAPGRVLWSGLALLRLLGRQRGGGAWRSRSGVCRCWSARRRRRLGGVARG